VALTSFSKIAPAIGMEIMGVIEPTAFISPVSEPAERCQHIEVESYARNNNTATTVPNSHYIQYCCKNITKYQGEKKRGKKQPS
jgi:hypothetical protein